MRCILFLISFFLFPLLGNSQLLQHQWSDNYIVSNGYNIGYQIEVYEPDNTIVVAGNHTAAGFNGAALVMKYDPNGSLLWDIHYSTGGFPALEDMGMDDQGNIYTVGGVYTYSSDFDPSPAVFTFSPPIVKDGYLSKYDINGNFIDALKIGGWDSDVFGEGDKINGVDVQGDTVYVCGRFDDQVDFDPRSSFGYDMTSTTADGDGFLAAYDASTFDMVWASQFSSTGTITTKKVRVLGDDIFMIGWFTGTVDFGNGIIKTTTSDKAFLAKFDLSGSCQWATMFPANVLWDIDIKDQNMIFVSGSAFADGYFARINSGGGIVFQRSIGSNGNDIALGIAVDDSLDIYVTGAYWGQPNDFDPQPTVFQAPDFPYWSIFLMKYNIVGNFITGFGVGSQSIDQSYAVDAASDGAVYITGIYDRPIQMNPYFAADPNGWLTDHGSAYDIFVSKYMPTDMLPLPVELLIFEGNTIGRDVLLEWSTATELNSDHFIVQRSRDIVNWINVGQIEAAGNSQSTIEYNLWDDNPFIGLSYYRLKMVDIDGSFEYSDIIGILVDHSSQIIAFYDMDNNVLNIGLAEGYESMTIDIIALNGQQVLSKEVYDSYVKMPIDLPAGIYLARIYFGQQEHSLKLYVQ